MYKETIHGRRLFTSTNTPHHKKNIQIIFDSNVKLIDHNNDIRQALFIMMTVDIVTVNVVHLSIYLSIGHSAIVPDVHQE